MKYNDNPLLSTDIYKVGHMRFYEEGTEFVSSYLVARKGEETCFYGAQPILKFLTTKITQEHADEFYEYHQEILGVPAPPDVVGRIQALVALGYIPLRIKSVKEGTVMPTRNVLMTVTNTVPGFHWVVGFFESYILKIWNTTTVATYSRKLKKLVDKFADISCDNRDHTIFQVHDFGYRGTSSDPSAELAGSAHLIHFRGTDTVPAVKFIKKNYGCTGLIGASVPATEHSVMCSYGRHREIEAFKRMLELYPSGIISIVSDTYNLWNVMTNFAQQLKALIEERDGKVVFRPDSGNPELIICGDPSAPEGTPEHKGCIRLLDEVFGTTLNKKGFKVLNPKVGLIYGDGMYYERVERILQKLVEMGYATSNIVFGIGGLLLQDHSRDDLGFAIKATHSIMADGEHRQLEKDPITDPGKKSLKGLMRLDLVEGHYITTDGVTPEEEEGGLLEVTFLDGKVLKPINFNQIRENAGAA